MGWQVIGTFGVIKLNWHIGWGAVEGEGERKKLVGQQGIFRIPMPNWTDNEWDHSP